MAVVTLTWAVVTADLVSMEEITECITVAIMEDIIMQGITETMDEVHLALVVIMGVTTEATTEVTMGCITEGITEGIMEVTMAAIITSVKSSTLDN